MTYGRARPSVPAENFELCTPSRSDSYRETMTFRTPFEPAQRGGSSRHTQLQSHLVTMRASISRKACTRGVSTIDPARSKPQLKPQHIAPAKPHRALRGRERACRLPFEATRRRNAHAPAMPSRLHVIMKFALQLELAARRCSLRECTWRAVGGRGDNLNPFDNSLVVKVRLRPIALFHFSRTEISSIA